MDRRYTDVFEILEELQKPQDFAILKLSEPFTVEDDANNAKRESDISADAREHTSVASLEAELEHYKDLFSKLRFSYVEQVTKEKFLRAIVNDPPLLVEPQENSELEAQLQEVKASLKSQKEEVAEWTKQLEAQGRDLAQRYERIYIQTTELSKLPLEVEYLESSISHLRSTTAPPSDDPDLNLPLSATRTLRAQKEAELEKLNTHLAKLQTSLPQKTYELERLEAELKQLDMQKQGTVAAAKEAQMRKEGWGGVDELEEKGRWAKACEAALREMLEVEG